MLKPEVSVPTSVVVAGLVYAVHQNATPDMASVRGSVPGTMPHADVDRAERQATWFSVALVSGVSLIAKDTTIFVVGGLTTIALAWWSRYANDVYPTVGRLLGADELAAATRENAEASSPAAPAPEANPYLAAQVM